MGIEQNYNENIALTHTHIGTTHKWLKANTCVEGWLLFYRHIIIIYDNGSNLL